MSRLSCTILAEGTEGTIIYTIGLTVSVYIELNLGMHRDELVELAN